MPHGRAPEPPGYVLPILWPFVVYELANYLLPRRGLSVGNVLTS